MKEKIEKIFEKYGLSKEHSLTPILSKLFEEEKRETEDRVRREAMTSLVPWLDGNVGASSEAIYLYMATGKIPRAFDAPSDSGDRGRCVTLLKCVPEWIPRLKEIEELHLEIKEIVTGKESEPWNEQIPLIIQSLKGDKNEQG